MSECVWVRVMYQPVNESEKSVWRYGWVFASDSLGRAWDTIRKVGQWRKWRYRVEPVLATDFDFPKRG